MDINATEVKKKRENDNQRPVRSGSPQQRNRNGKNGGHRRRRKKSRAFKRFLLIYSAVFVVIAIILLVMLNGLLKDYEASEPNNTMKNVIQQFTVENIDNLVDDCKLELTEFETKDAVISKLKKQMDGKKVTFERNSKLFTADNPAYLIKAGDNLIARVLLEKDGKNNHGFISWKLGKIEFNYSDGKETATKIQAPGKAIVTINGVEAGDDYRAEEKIVEETKNLSDYEMNFYNVEYKIEGLINEPEVKVTLDGIELKVKKKKDGSYVAKYPTDNTMLEEQTENIKSFYQCFGKYIINQGDLGLLLGYTVGNAQTILSDIPAVWAYPDSKINLTEFRDEKISNLVKYSDDCFTADVYFNLFVDFIDGYERDYIEYKTSMKLIYVRTQDGFKVADLIMYKADEDK